MFGDGGDGRGRPNAVEWVVVLGILSVFFGWAVWIAVRPNPDSLVLAIDRQGPRVAEDSELIVALTGTLEPDHDYVEAVYCENVWYWRNDRSLNLSVVVATAEHLVRAAEIVVDDDSNTAVAEAVERRALLTGSLTNEDRAELERVFGPDVLSAYLAARVRPPDPASAHRFLVWVANSTTTKQVVRIVDRGLDDQRSDGDRSRSEDGRPVEVAGLGTVLVDATC